MNWKRLSIRLKACCLDCFYLRRDVAQPWGALYPSSVGGDKCGCAGSGENSRAVSAGEAVWRAQLERMQFAGVLSQGGEFAFVLFSGLFTTIVSGRSDGAVVGDSYAFHDDHTAVDEACG